MVRKFGPASFYLRILNGLGLFLSLFAFACAEVPEKDNPPQIGGRWDLSIFQMNPNVTNYIIEVFQGGGSGTAQVKVYNDRGDKSGPETVIADQPIALGSCGLEVIFSESLGEPIYLELGDRWNIPVAEGIAYEPEAHPDNQSLAQLTVSGTYTCLYSACGSGLYQSFIPLAEGVKVGSGIQEYEMVQVPVNQTDANFQGNALEQTVLSLHLVGHNKKDKIQLCYQRRLQKGRQGRSSFLVRAVDQHRYLLLEDKSGDNFENKTETVCHSFRAQGKEIRVDFIFNLFGFEDQVWLDQIREKVNNALVFSYDFESGALENDLGPEQKRFELRIPAYQLGEAGVSHLKPLKGDYSFRAMGGRSLGLRGSVLEEASTQLAGYLGQIPGMDISGVMLEIYENDPGGYFASLSGALPDRQSILGTFTGEKEGCEDRGQFIVAINPGDIYPIDKPWKMTINGEAQYCKKISRFTETFPSFKPVQKADRFYSAEGEPLLDRYQNSYQMNGRVLGTALYFILEDYHKADYRNALFSGIIIPPEEGDTTTPNIAGTFTGWLGFKENYKCQVNGTFQVFFPQAQ